MSKNITFCIKRTRFSYLIFQFSKISFFNRSFFVFFRFMHPLNWHPWLLSGINHNNSTNPCAQVVRMWRRMRWFLLMCFVYPGTTPHVLLVFIKWLEVRNRTCVHSIFKALCRWFSPDYSFKLWEELMFCGKLRKISPVILHNNSNKQLRMHCDLRKIF